MSRSTKHAANYQLIKFLKFHIRQKNDPCTHISFTGGAWNIRDDELTEFYKLYSDAVRYFPMYIMEIQQNNIKPIIIDFDFHLEKKELVRSINMDIATSIVKILTLILIDIFGDWHDFTCVVLQRPEQHNKKGYRWTDGLHVQFPYIVCESMYHTILRNTFIKICDIKFNCQNAIESIYDKNITNWCLYLSTKPEVKPYQILKIYNNEKLDAYYQANKSSSIFTFVNLLSIRNKNNLTIRSMKCTKFYNHPSKIIINDLNLPQHKYVADTIINLLDMLYPSRVDNYDEWFKIGIILHYCHVTNTNETIEFYKIWIIWSLKSHKYSEHECDRLWKYYSSFSYYDYTIMDLFHLAETDNPILFQSWSQNELTL